jgi:hypothetical protein
MPSPPNLVSPPPPPATGSTAAATAVPAPPEQHPSSPWLGRADVFLRVIVQLYVGFILAFLPWTHVWSFNRFFLYFAPISHLVESGAIRGLVSGLGILNLWIAISEAIHYKEN